MTEMNEQNTRRKETEGCRQEDTYSFIRETRKKKPENRTACFSRLLAGAILAAAAGIIAALMFVLAVPVFQKLPVNAVNGADKIDIVSVTSSSEEESGEIPKTEEEEEPEVTGSPEGEKEDVIRQYSTMYREIQKVAKTAESSLVEVIGITSSLDYFNQNYENHQSLSGLIVAESRSSLYCLVENRSLKKAEKIQVIFCDGARVDAEFRTYDTETNLALLSISRADIADETWNVISVAQLGSQNTIRQGAPIIAVGSILGLGDSLEYGFITSMNNTVSLWDVNYSVLTTDLIGSSSGSGCLLNLSGEVVGYIDQSISSEDQNLVTAIPAKQLNPLIEGMINGTEQARFGIKGQTVSSDISESAGIPRGVLVTAVQQESPAMYAGIKELDVLTAINDEEIESFPSYRRILSSLSPDTTVTVSAMRMGKETYEEISFQLKLTKK